MTDISPVDFLFYQSLLLERSGLSLSQDKAYLLSTRLTPVASSLGYATLAEFTEDLRKTSDPALIRSVVEAMTTNETSFFRDSKPFTALKEILPQIMADRQRNKTIRIWSAACSSGQECYSIAMVMQEYLKDFPDWKCQIVGTDISQEMLNQARKGEYTQFEIQRGLTIQMMVKHFHQENGVWKIKDDLRQMVQFQYANLLENLSHLGMFDIIFCRNVLIYFNSETKSHVLNKMASRLSSNGMLFLGACETIMNLPVPFTSAPGLHGVFKLKAAPNEIKALG